MNDWIEPIGLVSALLVITITTIFTYWKDMKEFGILKEKLNEKTNATTVTKEHDSIRGDITEARSDITETRNDIKGSIIETRKDIAGSGTLLKESVKEVHQDLKDYVNRIAASNTSSLNVQQAVDTLTKLALQQGDMNQMLYDMQVTIQTLEKEKLELMKDTKNMASQISSLQVVISEQELQKDTLEDVNNKLRQELEELIHQKGESDKNLDKDDYGIER